jgi:hypothetical protein
MDIFPARMANCLLKNIRKKTDWRNDFFDSPFVFRHSVRVTQIQPNLIQKIYPMVQGLTQVRLGGLA